MRTNAIAVQHLSKTFRIPHEKITTMRGAFVNLLKKKTYEEFRAVDDVSFEVKKGEFFGIIGRNGSGKSTLLKMLAGIYAPDAGTMEIQGLISPFLELGIGFNPELSGRDNIYLNGTVLGLSRKTIDERFKSIVAFSELERFIDQKLKNYSSGMQVRLAFSVSIHANREILLMDEVLAVGDTNFQQKCIEEFNRYRDQQKTVVLVTHDTSMVERYCDRALLLRDGKIMAIGEPDDVIREYTYQNMSDEERRLLDAERQQRGQRSAMPAQQKPVEITAVTFLNQYGEEKKVFRTGDALTARVHFNARRTVEKPVFGVALHTEHGVHLAGPNTKTSNVNIASIAGVGWIDFRIEHVPFFTGRILFTAAIFNWECTIPFDFQDKAYAVKIISNEQNQYGVIKLQHLWSSQTK